MKKILLILLPAIISSCQSTDNNTTAEQKAELPEIERLPYPEVRKDTTVTDNYFGTLVKDPYRWLENDTSKQTAQWVKAQNEVTFDYLEQIPYRNEIRNRLEKLWNYPRMSTPFKKGEYIFYYYNDGLQDQSILYYRKGENGKEKVLIDPNKLSEEGTAAITAIGISNDHRYLAYGISRAGSDWKDIFIKDLKTGKKLDDHLKWVKFSGLSWYKDGFYYSRYDAPEKGKAYSKKNEYHKVYYHKVGSDQSEDRLIFEDPEHPLRNFNAKVTEDEQYLVVSSSEATSGNMVRIKKLGNPSAKFVTVVDNFDNDHRVITTAGEFILMMTNHNAPNKRLVKIDLNHPSPENWKNIIPEKEYVLTRIEPAGNKLVASYMEDVKSKLEVFDKDGAFMKTIDLPGKGMVSSFNGNKDDAVAFYSFTSYTRPSTVYKYDFERMDSEIYFEPEIDFNASDYVTNQVFYQSKDGEKIPMYITHKKGIELDGKNPCLLYGYGGFNISITPGFKVVNAVFLEQGGIYAVANLRGGSEYGEKWHKSGMLLNKQNVFDDFAAAAAYLKKKKYTSPEKTAIYGRSNGGLLIGATMTQNPDIAKVALPAVGVLDMLRYHKFTIGWAWAGEYGSSEDSVHFENLYSYSPLHNIKKGEEYPATMVTTADHDDRVVPAHSFKFISKLQDKQGGDNPVLIRVDVDAGHGSGKPISKIIDEWADIWAFTLYNLGEFYELPADKSITTDASQ